MSSAQREWFEKDYYAVLGVSPDANAKEITKVYRQLARENHPDANPGDSAAEERFKEITVAYDVVGDEKKRREYDEIRSAVKTGTFTGGSFGGFGESFDSGDLGDLLGGLFGSSFSGGGPQRGNDTNASVSIDFISALRGDQVTLIMDEVVLCGVCRGSGAAAGTAPVVCQTCGGSGSSAKQKGFFSFASPCRQCNGQGTVVMSPCLGCSGAGVRRVEKEVKVRIPEGVQDGQQIRLRGMGEQGAYGAPAGDLYVTVRVAPHKLFSRVGDDITIRVPVTFPEAVLGETIEVPLPLGGTVKVKVPEGTSSGKTLRVKGKGVKTKKAEGDLLVEIEITAPEKLDDDAKKLVRELSEKLDADPRRKLFGDS